VDVDAAWRLIDRLSRLPVLWILVVALSLRLLAGFVFPASSTEPYEFIPIARNVVDGHGFSYFAVDSDGDVRLEEGVDAERYIPSSYMPPMYCYVAVIAVVVGGDSDTGAIWAMRGLNLIMAAAMVLALRALTKRITGSERAGNLAALGFAVYPSFVYGATQVSASNLYLPIEMLLLLVLIDTPQTKSWRRWAAAGLVMGILGLLRGEALLVVPLATGWLWWASKRYGSRLFRAQHVAVFAGVALLLPGLWLARNAVTFGEPTVTVATSGGVNLWVGNHEGAKGSQKGWKIPPHIKEQLRELPASDDFELRRDEIFRKEAVDWLKDNPVDAAVGGLRKLTLLLTIDVYDHRARNPLYVGPWAGLAIVGFIGLRRWWRDPRTDAAAKGLIGWFLGIGLVIPVIFFFLARYRMPIESILLIFGSLWLVERASDYESEMSPSLASTVTVSPSPKVPSSTAMASGSATSRWMTRLRGRAPNAAS
jgi:4-amino-4-deoxy-L-arabinose transferase-like glycosyltransferase